MNGSAQRWWIVVAMALPLFLLSIDFYGITVALPSIGSELGAGTTALQWTVNAFNLSMAAPLIAFGRLGDLVGRRRTMLAGIVLFALGSAICGLAPGIATLIVGRCVQGVAVALFSAGPLSIVASVFSPAERGLAFGICSAVGACGSAIGPLVGGTLTELLSWRWLFLVNLPIGALTAGLILLVVPESRDETAKGGLDLLGVATITAGLTGLTFGLQLGDDWGWSSPWVVAGLLLGPLLILAFVAVERRQRQPLVDLALFQQPPFLQAQIVAVLGNFGFSAIVFFATLYLQHVLQLSPIPAGLALLAFSACFVLTLPVTGRWIDRVGGRRAMMLGMALMVAAFLLFQPAGTSSGLAWVIGALAVAGIGQAFAYNASTTMAMNAAPDAGSGAAAGVLNGARQLGSVLGIAVTGAVFQVVESSRLLAALSPQMALDPDERTIIASLLSGSEQARTAILDLASMEHHPDDPAFIAFVDASVSEAFVAALQAGMLLCAFVSLLGILATIPLRRRPEPVAGLA
ncbi:MFS transporter [Geminicoccus roseus]|uniref:MFS transporter n=1 Tax=Geminicoccus roseus TaxID=404900 RepID=UPI0004236879|nr:MFS transporter [Geminicoccus roseus]